MSMKALNDLRRAEAAEAVAEAATMVNTGPVEVFAYLDKETPQVIVGVRHTMTEAEFAAHVRAEMRLAGIVEATPKAAAKSTKKAVRK
jgi:hypothetical protein